MKRILFFLLLLSSLAQAQRVSDLPLYIGDLDSAFVPATIIVNGAYATRKVYGRDLVRKLLDSINTALNDKLSGSFTINGYPISGNPSITKADLGLTFAENTADLDKPISNATQAALDDKVDKVEGQSLSDRNYTEADSLKLDGIEDGATANSPDATLLNRANHTGSQAQSTVTGLPDSLANKQNKGLSASKGLIIGDSESAAGWGGTRLDSLILTGSDTAIGNTITNQAVGGHTILQQQTAYLADANRAQYDWVIVHVGLNDVWDYSESAATALGRYQTLINNIRSNSPKATIIAAAMQPVRKSYFNSFSNTNALTAYSKWRAMNDAIMGVGSNKITGVDYRIDEHSKAIGDSLGNLVAIYNHGDDIHTNTRGRRVVASAFRKALNQAGYLNNRTFVAPNQFLNQRDSNEVDLKVDYLRLGNVKLTKVPASSSTADSVAYVNRSTNQIEMRPAPSGTGGGTINADKIIFPDGTTNSKGLQFGTTSPIYLYGSTSPSGALYSTATQIILDNNRHFKTAGTGGLANTTSSTNALFSTPDSGPLIQRNIADANPALIVNLQHASSTGNILKLQFVGSDKFTVDRNGNVVTTGKYSNVLTTEQFRFGYDGSNYIAGTVGATGNVTMNAAGSDGRFIFQSSGTTRLTVSNVSVSSQVKLQPSSDDAIDLGSTTNQWQNAYVSQNLYIDQTPVAKTVWLPSPVTNNNAVANTLQDVTGLGFPVQSGKTYRFKFTVFYTAAATATGSRWTINGPSTSALHYYTQWDIQTNGIVFYLGQTTYNCSCTVSTTSNTTASNRWIAEGILTASADGTVIARFASEVSGSAITADKGFVEYQEMP